MRKLIADAWKWIDGAAKDDLVQMRAWQLKAILCELDRVRTDLAMMRAHPHGEDARLS